jgi:hypothetical protein
MGSTNAYGLTEMLPSTILEEDNDRYTSRVRNEDAGEGGGAQSLSSAGGPCWCDLQVENHDERIDVGKHITDALMKPWLHKRLSTIIRLQEAQLCSD